MDLASIQKHVEPWRQILMFFVRTQAPHDWKSPQYQFTKGQRHAWEQLLSVAQEQTDARRGRSPEPIDEDGPEDEWTPVQATCMCSLDCSVREGPSALPCREAMLLYIARMVSI
jgi:hypothetical protein